MVDWDGDGGRSMVLPIALPSFTPELLHSLLRCLQVLSITFPPFI